MSRHDAERQYDCPLTAGPCVPPRATEREVVTLPGATPDTALRVKVEATDDGYVRLEHLAHNAKLGWYVQKSLCVDRDHLRDLATALRKADCLMPPHANDAGDEPIPFRLPTPHEPEQARQRRSS